jgi:heterodisulfide reductase subunit A
MVAARQAHWVRQRYPDSQVSVFYMDMRAFGKGFEEYYDQLREDGVLYRRGNPSEILRRGDRVVVRAEDTLLGEYVEVEADMVVLAVGMEPRADSGEVAALLKLSRSGDGFLMEAHPKLRPVDTAMAGIYLAGCCQGPKDIGDTVSQARAAASAAMIPLMRGSVRRCDHLSSSKSSAWLRAVRALHLWRPVAAPRARRDDRQPGALPRLWGLRDSLPLGCDQCPPFYF